jgi:tight adherence protein C
MMVDGMALTASVLLVVAVLTLVAAVSAVMGGESVLFQGLAPFARAAQPLQDEELSRARLDLTRAGFRTEQGAQLFFASKVLLAIVLAMAFLWFNSSRPRPLELGVLVAISVFAAGYYVPTVWLKLRVRARQLDIERGLPDTLDLLVTCVEAGLGLDAALQRVASETKLAWPLLGDELELAFLEVKAGIARTEAIRRLAHRTGVGELKSLAATLAQTEAFGTSVGLALRVQAEGIRTRHMQRAEEKAGYVSVRMALPLIMCILPALVAILIGPAVLRILSVFFPGTMGSVR